jgi:CRISPR-associated protein Csb2
VIGLRLTFTAGRYHATGWDHHVNEGVPEWPPAPWRILRALAAGSYRLTDGEREGVPKLVERLTALPVYRLPPSATAHIRHYMPTDKAPVKVIDTFVAVGDGARAPEEVLVWWPNLELSEHERELLQRLSEQIGYLGRAESWVEVSVTDVGEHVLPNAQPRAVDKANEKDTVRLLAVQHADELATWRKRWESMANQPGKQKKSGPALPASVWDVLNVDTSDLQRERWSQAPGSCWVEYELDESPRVQPQPRRRRGTGPQGAMFLLRSAVLPTIAQTLPVAERMRSAAMRAAEQLTPSGRVPEQLSGKDEREVPLSGHGHAYFLPLARRSREGREQIDRVLVWARDGLDDDTWASLQHVVASRRRLRGSADGHPLQLILAGHGDFRELRAMLAFDPARPTDGSWLDCSREWVSATPFVPPKFWKLRRGQLIDAPEDQLRWLIDEVVGHAVEKIEQYPCPSSDAFGWNHFVRVRKKDRSRLAARPGLGFKITFANAVSGPIALGYGAHFGLGLFRPFSSKRDAAR